MNEVTLLRTTTATLAVALAIYIYIRIKKNQMKKYVLRSGGIADQETFLKGKGSVVGG